MACGHCVPAAPGATPPRAAELYVGRNAVGCRLHPCRDAEPTARLNQAHRHRSLGPSVRWRPANCRGVEPVPRCGRHTHACRRGPSGGFVRSGLASTLRRGPSVHRRPANRLWRSSMAPPCRSRLRLCAWAHQAFNRGWGISTGTLARVTVGRKRPAQLNVAADSQRRCRWPPLNSKLGGMQLVVVFTRVTMLNRLLGFTRLTVASRAGRPSDGGRRATAASRRCPFAGVTRAPAGADPRAGLSVQVLHRRRGAGRPSIGGRRTGCGVSTWHRRGGFIHSSVYARIKRSTQGEAVWPVSSFWAHPAASGLPNSTLQRTANGVAVGRR